MRLAARVFKTWLFIVVIFCALLGALCLVCATREYCSIVRTEKRLEAPVKNDSIEPSSCNTIQECYLNLLKKYLIRYDFDNYARVRFPLDNLLARNHLALVYVIPVQQANKVRLEGRAWPYDNAETMIGLHRLNNIEYCVRDVLSRNVPGDLIEAGAWRGGATIFMRAVLKAYGDHRRKVWVADSFQGLPKPDAAAFPIDAQNYLEPNRTLAVSLDEVKRNFARYGLLDDQVRFLPGWFRDTLPHAPVDKLAVLRIDGDLYESTIECLRYLYPKVSPGGYIIDDDYGALINSKRAVDDFRAQQGITSELKHIDWTGVYWQKTK